MKSLSKKITVIILTFLFLICGVSFALFNVKADEVDPPAEKTKTQIRDETFFIGSWHIPFYDFAIADLETQIKDLRACGVNWIMQCCCYLDINGDTVVWMTTKEQWLEFDKVCQKYDMYYMFSQGTYGSAGAEASHEIVKDLKNCLWYYITDEPGYVWEEIYGNICQEYRSVDPDMEPYVNLFGIYLDKNTLGGTYENYIQHWIDVCNGSIEYLSYDFYPFNLYSTNTTQYFENMEIIRSKALKNNLKVMSCLQTGQWSTFMRVPNAGEVRWQLYTSLAYGQKSPLMFCYLTPKWVSIADGGEEMRNHAVLNDGTKTQLYYDCSAAYNDAHAMGSILMQLECLGAFHSTENYQGAEVMPDDFIVKPQNKSDVIVSYMGNTKGGDDHIMIVNNSWEHGLTETFQIDPEYSGIEELWYFNPATGEYEKAEIIDGMITISFESGEGKLFKIVGDANISFELTDPVVSLPSGEYGGAQYVTITKGSEKERVYYTLDGSYPTAQSNLYTAPIKIGEDNASGEYTLRVASVSGKNISRAQTFYYYIINGESNVALYKPLKISKDYKNYNFVYSSGTDKLTDGVADKNHALYTEKRAWATVDLGVELDIGSVDLSLYDGLEFSDVIVQVSSDPNFLTGVKTVFNSDADNSAGYGVGTDTYTPTADGNYFNVAFEKTAARYVRVTDFYAGKSIFTEIGVMSAVEKAAPLTVNEADFTVNAGSWSFTSDSVSQAAGSDYLGSVTYKKKLNGFVLTADFSATVGSDDYVGFEIGKKNISDNEETVGGTGITVAIQSDGMLFVAKSFVTYGAQVKIKNFDFGEVNKIRLVAVGNLISVSVNGENVYSYNSGAFVSDGGYLAFHGGASACSFKNIVIEEQDFDCILDTPTSVSYLKTDKGEFGLKLAVDVYTHYDDIIALLPTKMKAIDNEGVTYDVSVAWFADSYDRAQDGVNFSFYGEISGLPAGVINASAMRATAKVFVRYKIDYSLLKKYIALAEKLNESDFTADSWSAMHGDLVSAKEALTDDYLSPSNVNLLYTKLKRTYEGLTLKNADKTALKNALAKNFAEDDYTAESFAAYAAAVRYGEKVVTDPMATVSDAAKAVQLLDSAEKTLVKKGEVSKITAAISNLSAIDRSKYTARSLAKLDAAVSAAYAAAKTEISETAVGLYVKLIESAVDGLIEK